MARLPALIDDLAAHDVRDRTTIEVMARMIREAGFVQTTGRGRGAAEMTAADAAALLIGVCTAEVPRDAADAVRNFTNLEMIIKDDAVVPLANVPPLISDLTAAKNLGAAISALVSRADDLTLLLRWATKARELWRSSLQGSERGRLGPPRINDGFEFYVRFYLPFPSADIFVRWEDNDDGEQQFYHLRRSFGRDRTVVKDGREEAWLDADRSIAVTLYEQTFVRLHKLLGL